VHRYLTFVILSILLSGCHPMRGFLESRFELSADARLPVWFKTQLNTYSRDNLTLVLRYYTPLFDVDDSVLTLELKDGTSIATVTGRNFWHPKTIEVKDNCSKRSRVWPVYVIFTVQDKSEILQFRKMEPKFYVSDEEDVKNNPPTCNAPTKAAQAGRPTDADLNR